MDKRQFADQVIRDVRSLSVTSVLSTRIDMSRHSGRNRLAYCPFHNDEKIGSFVATDAKGIWKCFSCGTGGDTVKFVSLFDNINYIEAAFKLAMEFGIINREEYEEYFERKRYSRDIIVALERKYSELDKKRMENDIAEDHILDQVFRLFINECTLSKEHKEHLMKERNLTEEEIKEGMYFTFPERRGKFLSEFKERLNDRFKDGELILAKIPGFYLDKKYNRFTFAFHKGIGIGIQNANGQVVGIQVRHDKKKDNKRRYVWFSSSFATCDEKFEYGTSSGSPVDVVYPTVLRNRNIIITEGRFKAQQIAKEVGSIAVSVQGVASWKGIVKELEAIPKAPAMKKLLPDKEFVLNSLLVAFDADMNYKVQVFEQARRMTDALEQVDNDQYPVYYLNWDENLGKGMDDILISGNKEAIKRYDKKQWDKQYEVMLEDILENENYSEIRKVPSEVVRHYYQKHFDGFSPLEKGQFSAKHSRKMEREREQRQTVS